MKKYLLPLLAAAVVLLAGCSNKTRVITSYYNVGPNQWDAHLNDNGDGTFTPDYYYSEWTNEDITPEVVENGYVLVYYVDGAGRDNQLPYVLPYYDEDQDAYYMENIRFDVKEGRIRFIIEDSDFGTYNSVQFIQQKERTLQFKVCCVSYE
ncbi:MAG: hypothetical protein IJU81_06560 [Bacteroidales bacterium]|nr:hypothetical protein [Bacteroidales bacterium]